MSGWQHGRIGVQLYRDHAPANGQAVEAGDRRGQIIAATIRLLAHDGIAEVTTRQIAAESGLNLATLHYLFGGKDRLLLAVLDSVTSTMIATLTAAVQPRSGLQVALTTSLAALWLLTDQTPALPLVRCEVLLHATRRPALACAARQQQWRYCDALQDLYRTACAECETSDIPFDELAAFVASAVDGFTLQTAARATGGQIGPAHTHLLGAALALVKMSPTGAAPERLVAMASDGVELHLA